MGIGGSRKYDTKHNNFICVDYLFRYGIRLFSSRSKILRRRLDRMSPEPKDSATKSEDLMQGNAANIRERRT
jgi:hypothetical protein